MLFVKLVWSFTIVVVSFCLFFSLVMLFSSNVVNSLVQNTAWKYTCLFLCIFGFTKNLCHRTQWRCMQTVFCLTIFTLSLVWVQSIVCLYLSVCVSICSIGSSAIAERPARRSVSSEMLNYTYTLRVSQRSTLSNFHVLFRYLHSFVHASF